MTQVTIPFCLFFCHFCFDTEKSKKIVRTTYNTNVRALIVRKKKPYLLTETETSTRRKTLEDSLKAKADLKELESKGIYKTPLQVTQEELGKSLIRDALKEELSDRPAPKELEDAGPSKTRFLLLLLLLIMRSLIDVIFSQMDVKREELEKSQKIDSLEHEMKQRMDLSEVQKSGIYKTPIQASQEHLQKQQVQDTVKNQLTKRQSVTELNEAGAKKKEMFGGGACLCNK
ncbi:hypothetical protein RFI_10041 [Reticulomyxa filosa]|uniref:Uncharacterized protein n=1 Tax=Reticulomyxa filosa TaxID=46433 RepID=X6NLC2_RETFI|nr:hypothetical protein RFI_10041 [Reticulomyxa filosa]|eukprot:ETO27090.1 hypothetical protein RFI_10041 [Reticulomyxa filosa]